MAVYGAAPSVPAGGASLQTPWGSVLSRPCSVWLWSPSETLQPTLPVDSPEGPASQMACHQATLSRRHRRTGQRCGEQTQTVKGLARLCFLHRALNLCLTFGAEHGAEGSGCLPLPILEGPLVSDIKCVHTSIEPTSQPASQGAGMECLQLKSSSLVRQIHPNQKKGSGDCLWDLS